MKLMIGIERRDRLVGEQERGLDGKRPRQHHPRPLAARQGRHATAGEGADLGFVHRGLDRAPVVLARVPEERSMGQAAEPDHILDRHRPMGVMALGQIGEPLGEIASRPVRDRPSVERCHAGEAQEIGGRPEKRRLARTVRADQADKLTGLGAERDVLDHGRAVVAHRKVGQHEPAHSCALRLLSRR